MGLKVYGVMTQGYLLNLSYVEKGGGPLDYADDPTPLYRDRDRAEAIVAKAPRMRHAPFVQEFEVQD